MDYVVFGIGFGATILVLGLLLRDFGPRLRFRSSRDGRDVLSAEELVGKVSWTRFCTALGSVLALAGAAFLLITLVSMILVVSDDTGLWVMAISYALLLIVMAYWTWAYFHRFGSYGILPERSEPEPVSPRIQRQQPAEDDDDIGPPVPWEDDATEVGPAAGEIDTAEAGSVSDDDEMVAEADEAEGLDTAAEEVEADPEEVEADSAPTVRLETPEERIAHAESPIDHGSAEGDLDLAASGPRRPGGFSARRPPTGRGEVDDDPDPEPAEGRDRA